MPKTEKVVNTGVRKRPPEDTATVLPAAKPRHVADTPTPSRAVHRHEICAACRQAFLDEIRAEAAELCREPIVNALKECLTKRLVESSDTRAEADTYNVNMAWKTIQSVAPTAASVLEAFVAPSRSGCKAVEDKILPLSYTVATMIRIKSQKATTFQSHLLVTGITMGVPKPFLELLGKLYISLGYSSSTYVLEKLPRRPALRERSILMLTYDNLEKRHQSSVTADVKPLTLQRTVGFARILSLRHVPADHVFFSRPAKIAEQELRAAHFLPSTATLSLLLYDYLTVKVRKKAVPDKFSCMIQQMLNNSSTTSAALERRSQLEEPLGSLISLELVAANETSTKGAAVVIDRYTSDLHSYFESGNLHPTVPVFGDAVTLVRLQAALRCRSLSDYRLRYVFSPQIGDFHTSWNFLSGVVASLCEHVLDSIKPTLAKYGISMFVPPLEDYHLGSEYIELAFQGLAYAAISRFQERGNDFTVHGFLLFLVGGDNGQCPRDPSFESRCDALLVIMVFVLHRHAIRTGFGEFLEETYKWMLPFFKRAGKTTYTNEIARIIACRVTMEQVRKTLWMHATMPGRTKRHHRAFDEVCESRVKATKAIMRFTQSDERIKTLTGLLDQLEGIRDDIFEAVGVKMGSGGHSVHGLHVVDCVAKQYRSLFGAREESKLDMAESSEQTPSPSVTTWALIDLIHWLETNFIPKYKAHSLLADVEEQ